MLKQSLVASSVFFLNLFSQPSVANPQVGDESGDLLVNADPIADESMAELRGKNDQQLTQIDTRQFSNSEQNGTSTDNEINGDPVNGGNIIESGALEDNRGHITLIQNSGNQVVIQDSTIYNITLVDE